MLLVMVARSALAVWGEQIVELKIHDARIQINLPKTLDPKKPTRLVLYGLPNGNSIEWSVGCEKGEGIDWHFDGQHIGAQTRSWREVNPRENLVVAYLEADKKSWPTWRKGHENANPLIRTIVDEIIAAVPGKVDHITLSAHSGGGSFVSGYIEGGDEIPSIVDRIAYLDANYSYDDALHGGKLLKWLDSSKDNRFIVIAYDDREITLNGKKVVSDTGGTYRATHRLIDFLSKTEKPVEGKLGAFDTWQFGQQIRLFIHPNPANKILHTLMVGEMSGWLFAMTLDTSEEDKWGQFQGPRTWNNWVEPARLPPSTRPVTQQTLLIPARPDGAPGGLAFMQSIAELNRTEREQAILKEFLRGNVPAFLRKPVTVKISARCADGRDHTIECLVLPDYLAVGTDDDFVRVPMNPHTAQAIADTFGCSLPTRKLVDDIDSQATVHLEPHPMTEKREAVETFIEFNRIIETQRKGKPLGELICGIKKDVIITNRLLEKPNPVAIYGWRKLDGKPIQPNYVGHVDWYVDYSHGIRLIQREVLVDGKLMLIDAVMRDPVLCALVSDEGVLKVTRYP